MADANDSEEEGTERKMSNGDESEMDICNKPVGDNIYTC